MAKRHTISVKTTYRIGGKETEPTETQIFNEKNVEPARLGLPIGTTPSKPQPGDYSYSGVHDQGPLVPPRESGDMALLIGCVQAAKRFNDDYLTRIIEEEKKKQEARLSDEHQKKKPKTGS